MKQIIYEEDLNKIKCLRGIDIIPYLKLGVKVVRGEDWKWDNQVYINHTSDLCLYYLYILFYSIFNFYRMVHLLVKVKLLVK